MSFCKFCGRQLAEGEVCNCNAQAVPPVAPVQPQYNQQYNQTQFNSQQFNQQANQQANQMIGTVLDLLKGIFTKPADAVKAYVQKGALLAPIIIMLIMGFLSSAELVINRLVANAEAKAKFKAEMFENDYEEEMFNALFGETASNSLYDKFVAPYSTGEIIGGFFLEFISVLAVAAVLAAILMLMINFFEKDKKVTYVQGLSIVSLSSLITVPVAFVSNFIGMIPVKFFGMFEGWMNRFATAYGLMLLFIAFRSVTKDENRMPISYAVAAVCSAVVSSVIGLMM